MGTDAIAIIRNERVVVCEKIINDINAILLNDADLSSFEIIPKELTCNKSPVLHVGHNLGLESWCIQHVYDHSHNFIIAHRRQSYTQQQRTFRQEKESAVLVKYLNVALLINSDVATFWHLRRQLMQKNLLSINKELQFTALVLTKNPKSNEAFAYRRWLYSFQSADAIDWPIEIGICERSADRRSSNYHSWVHRQWALKNAPAMLKSEIMRSEKFIQKHVSDHSSYHYRHVVLLHAYETCFYVIEELPRLEHLRKFINTNYIEIGNVKTTEDILRLMLPNVDQETIGTERIYTLLYCSNLAAKDMQLCEEQISIYGQLECFNIHRRISLKFIVEQCLKLTAIGQNSKTTQSSLTTTNNVANKIDSTSNMKQLQVQKSDYNLHPLICAIRKTESRLGRNHRIWCNLHLGFNYKDID